MTLEELRKKKEDYVITKADEIQKDILERGDTNYSMSTCDDRRWDKELHNSMDSIAYELRKRGFSVSSSRRFGVTDWVISINI